MCISELMMQTTLPCTTASLSSLCPPPSLQKGTIERAAAAQSFPAGRDCLPACRGASCITQSQRAWSASAALRAREEPLEDATDRQAERQADRRRALKADCVTVISDETTSGLTERCSVLKASSLCVCVFLVFVHLKNYSCNSRDKVLFHTLHRATNINSTQGLSLSLSLSLFFFLSVVPSGGATRRLCAWPQRDNSPAQLRSWWTSTLPSWGTQRSSSTTQTIPPSSRSSLTGASPGEDTICSPLAAFTENTGSNHRITCVIQFFHYL